MVKASLRTSLPHVHTQQLALLEIPREVSLKRDTIRLLTPADERRSIHTGLASATLPAIIIFAPICHPQDSPSVDISLSPDTATYLQPLHNLPRTQIRIRTNNRLIALLQQI